MTAQPPEKAKLLAKLKKGRFNVPPFIYLPAADFKKDNFQALAEFLSTACSSFKIIARSAHPGEHSYKGGTFDSLETYADVNGVKYARKRIINSALTTRRLSIARQKKFNHAQEIDIDEMGVIVMPYLEGASVMAKMVEGHWEFGYYHNPDHKVQIEPYITRTPHDRNLLQLSEDIQRYLGFRCELEYIISEDGEIHVVQAKDISQIETLEKKESERALRLDGLRRIRKRRNYRERPIYVMDNKSIYLRIIDKCEDLVLGGADPAPGLDDILGIIAAYEAELDAFAMRHERFAVLGFVIQVPEDLYQIANHYLDDRPDLQKQLSKALYTNIYKIDYLLSGSDTLIAKDRIRMNFGTHSAYGIDTIRNPLWSVYWHVERHDQVVRELRRLGFKTGDTVGIDVDAEEKPTIFRF
ncbi:MAG: hypothetical protein MUP74_05140 [Desulfobacterales bacterium]|nr:hypothetical protein [Desulfobacterales bacterium]